MNKDCSCIGNELVFMFIFEECLCLADEEYNSYFSKCRQLIKYSSAINAQSPTTHSKEKSI